MYVCTVSSPHLLALLSSTLHFLNRNFQLLQEGRLHVVKFISYKTNTRVLQQQSQFYSKSCHIYWKFSFFCKSCMPGRHLSPHAYRSFVVEFGCECNWPQRHLLCASDLERREFQCTPRERTLRYQSFIITCSMSIST